MMRPRVKTFAVAALVLIGTASASDRAAAPGQIDFGRDILPILSQNCFQCHGPDEGTREAKLRLDTPEGMFRTRNDLTVVVPGKPAESELILRLSSKDEEEVMPPPDSNKHLTPAQIELFKRWVAEGAPWGKHWAYERPPRPSIPNVPGAGPTLRNPIDNFIRARLADERLNPSPE